MVPCGQKRHGLEEAVGGAPDIVLGDLMGAVDDFQFPVHALDHAVHGADGAFLVGEISLEDQDGFHDFFCLKY